MHRYLLSEEGFRIKFRSARPEHTETYTQFADRISGYLKRWIEIGEVDTTYEGLFEMIVREQTLKICGKELVLFLKERKTKTLSEMTALADRYAEAHNQRYFFDNKSGRDNKTKLPNTPSSSAVANPKLSKERMDRLRFERRCFQCGEYGHIARDCSKRGNRPRGQQGAPEIINKGASLVVEDTSEGNSVPQFTVVKETAGACLPVLQWLCGCQEYLGKDVTLKCGHKLPIVSTACTGSSSMPVTEGYLGNTRVQVMGDTGCSTVTTKAVYLYTSVVFRHG